MRLRLRLTHRSLAILAGAHAVAPPLATPPADSVVLAPHRAIYDLKLARTRQPRPQRDVRGRILYDFSGSACEGYELQFRQVSELDSGEGKDALSDCARRPGKTARPRKFRFNSENKHQPEDQRTSSTASRAQERRGRD